MNRVAEDRAEFAARLALLATRGISARRSLALIMEAGSAVAALGRVRQVAGDAAWVSLKSDAVRQRVRRALDAVAASDMRVTCHDDEDYPALLRLRLDDEMPPVLFLRGNTDVLDRTAAGIVGSRRASVYGQDVARQLGGAVARAGGCVVSGMARGIDAAAHEGALEAPGATIAVLGCGVDVVYPLEHDKLYRHIGETGLLLSEQLPGESPRRHTFTYRNRIIAALSSAVVVVEAAARSGALATANHAARMGVHVFGVPNSMYAPGMQGILGLFRDGASVYTGSRDFLEGIGLLHLTADAAADEPEAAAVFPDDAPLASRLWAVLRPDPLHIDELAATVGAPAAVALAGLLELELDGKADQHAGLRFSRGYATRHTSRQPG